MGYIASMEVIELRVSGMSCSHCEAAVREKVDLVPGVVSVSADAATGRVRIEGEGLDRSVLEAAVVEAGYAIEP